MEMVIAVANHKGGIYKIQSITKPEREYIGSAVNIGRRWYEHLFELKKNIHRNKRLQNHYNKYGESDLQFTLLSACNINELIEREQHYINSLDPFFNICKNAGNVLGLRHSEETKKKLSEAHKGKPISKETRQKLSKALTGTHQTEEHRRKNSERQIGGHPSEETRRKLSESHKGPRPWRVGIKASEETKKKLSESHRGARPWMVGKLSGIKLSGEHRQKISEGLKKRYQIKKTNTIP